MEILKTVTTLAQIAQSVATTISLWNQSKSLALQSKNLELAQKRDNSSQDLARDRMVFEGKMELLRQAIRAKERQEDKQFNLQLKQMESEQLLKTQQMNQAFSALEAEKQRQFTEAIEKFKTEVSIAINKDNLSFSLWKEETSREFAIEMKMLDLRLNQLLSKETRQNERRDRTSPIFAVTDDILNLVSSYEQPPLSIFISPPVLRFDTTSKSGIDPQFPALESSLKASLRDLFKQYSQNQRPISFHAGEWITKSRSGESAARDLFRYLKTAPVVILETEVEESFLNINIGFWNGEAIDIRFDSVVRKLRWCNIRDEILETLIKQQESIGKPLKTLSPYEQEKLTRKCREDLGHFIEILHCIHAGMIADEYFLLYAQPRQLPLLPKLLPSLFAEAALSSEMQLEYTKQVDNYCNALFDGLAVIAPHSAVELRIAWAETIRNTPERYGFESQVKSAMQDWLKQRTGKCDTSTLSELCTEINNHLVVEDVKFVESVNSCLDALDNPGRLRYCDLLLSKRLAPFAI